MVMRLCVLLIMFFTMSSCEADYMPPYLLYKAKFDTSKTDATELVIKEVAKKWGLRIYEKDREQMKLHTQGKDAFFIALYFKEDPVLILTNSGFGELLVLSATDYKKMPISDLGKLTNDVMNGLKGKFDIEFEKSDESQAKTMRVL